MRPGRFHGARLFAPGQHPGQVPGLARVYLGRLRYRVVLRTVLPVEPGDAQVVRFHVAVAHSNRQRVAYMDTDLVVQEVPLFGRDHHNPVLHLVQLIRDEAHRFAVTFHRKRRQMRDRATELLEIPGVGTSTTRRLLEHFGSLQAVKQADEAALSAVVTRVQADAIRNHFRK